MPFSFLCASHAASASSASSSEDSDSEEDSSSSSALPTSSVSLLPSDDALEELLRLGVESTNWNSVKAGGYLGAFTSDGFAPPVIAQLATDLEEAMPEVLLAPSLSLTVLPSHRPKDKRKNARLGLDSIDDFATSPSLIQRL